SHEFTEVVLFQESACYPLAEVSLKFSSFNLAKSQLPNTSLSSAKDTPTKLLNYLSTNSHSNLLHFNDWIISGHANGQIKVWNARTAICKIWPIHQRPIVTLKLENQCLIVIDDEGKLVQQNLSDYGIAQSSQLLKNQPYVGSAHSYKAVKNA